MSSSGSKPRIRRTISSGTLESHVDAETVHAVGKHGSGDAAELATYGVEEGKPLELPGRG